MYSKHKNGNLSELIAQEFFLKYDYEIAIPLNQFFRYDLLVKYITEYFQKVQIKTIYWDNSKKRNICSLVTSHIRGNNKRQNKKYKKNDFDLLCAVEINTRSIYLIPFDKIKGRRSITFYPQGEKNKTNTKHIDFEKYKKQ